MRQPSPFRSRFAFLLGGILLLVPLAAIAEGQAVRPPAKAGSWYPAEPAKLRTLIDTLLAQAPVTPLEEGAAIRALIVPHAAYAYSGATAAAAYRMLQGRGYRRVILLGPAHRALGESGLSILEVDAYATPLGPVPLDLAAIAGLRNSPLVHATPEWHEQEHSLEIQLPFLQRALQAGWRLLPILMGEMRTEDYAQAAEALRPLLDEETLLVVSTDFTHYGAAFGYLPFPPDEQVAERIRELDMGAFDRIAAKDPEGFLAYRRDTGITVCGYRPLALLLRLLSPETKVTLLQYAGSGELTGNYRHSVSYLAAMVTRPEAKKEAAPVSGEELSEAQLRYLYELAELTIRARVLKDPADLDALQQRLAAVPGGLEGKGAAFVTLWEHEQLRGCVGTVLPKEPLFKSVMRSAEEAALHDSRFLPVAADEVPDLRLELSVLSPPQRIESSEQCVAGRHGIVLKKDGRQAVYLPEVASRMGWDCPETLRRLCLKAGLPEDAWRNGAELEVFTSRKFAPPH